jgi:hypothetical protein
MATLENQPERLVEQSNRAARFSEKVPVWIGASSRAAA